MSAPNKRSKRRSAANSKQQPEHQVFFIERNLGRHKVAQALRDAGEDVEVHDEHLNQDVADEVWIELVAKNGWLAITKDKNIRYRRWELDAIKEHRARIFVLRAKNVTAEEISEILIKACIKIKRFAKKNPPPYVVGVYRDGSINPYPID